MKLQVVKQGQMQYLRNRRLHYLQTRLLLASNLFNHQFETPLHICNPFEFLVYSKYQISGFKIMYDVRLHASSQVKGF